MELPDGIEPDEVERLEEIRNLPHNVIVDAIKWWNESAPDQIKRFIIVTAYYECMLSTSNLVDEALKEWS